MERYLMFMFCVFMTLLVFGALMLVVYISWNGVIDPIIDRIQAEKDNYWETMYRNEEIEKRKYRDYLSMLKINDPETLDCVIVDSVSREVMHNSIDFTARVKITFTINELCRNEKEKMPCLK